MSQQQQPLQGNPNHPNDIPIQPKDTPITQSSSSHSNNGSFGTVFIVLAVILVISVLACVIGRICNKKGRGGHPPKQKGAKQSRNFHSREDQEDIEFGYDKRNPTSKVAASNGDPIPMSTMPSKNGHEASTEGVKFTEDHIESKHGP